MHKTNFLFSENSTGSSIIFFPYKTSINFLPGNKYWCLKSIYVYDKRPGSQAWSEWPYKIYSWRQNCTSEWFSTSAMQRVSSKVQFWRLFILQQFKIGPNWLFFWFKLHCGPQGKEHKQLANLQPLNKIALTWGDSLNIAYDFFFSLFKNIPVLQEFRPWNVTHRMCFKLNFS